MVRCRLSSDPLHDVPLQGMTIGKIIWLASYPKSGNTWTRSFLLHLFMNPKQPFPPDRIGEMSPIDTSSYWLEQVADKQVDTWQEEEVAKLRSPVQHEIAKRAPDSIFVKTHFAHMTWRGFPVFNHELTAGAIYIVRNPLDVIASFAAHSNTTLDHIVGVLNDTDHVLPGAKDQVPHLIGSWSQHVASWTANPGPALHVMRYEDMIEQPAETFGGLVKFLGLNPPPDRLERALNFSSFETLQSLEQSEGFNERTPRQERFFRAGKSGGWRDELNDKQVARIVAAHREQMARFGYVPQGY